MESSPLEFTIEVDPCAGVPIVNSRLEMEEQTGHETVVPPPFFFQEYSRINTVPATSLEKEEWKEEETDAASA